MLPVESTSTSSTSSAMYTRRETYLALPRERKRGIALARHAHTACVGLWCCIGEPVALREGIIPRHTVLSRCVPASGCETDTSRSSSCPAL